MQMTFTGVPSIYYGDEYGLEGLSDPGNRRGLPRPGDPHEYDMETIIKNAAGVRRELPELIDGTIEPFAPEADVLGYTRRSEAGAATVLINRSRSNECTVRIPALGECATDVVSGAELPVAEDGTVEVHLWQFGSAVVSFHPAQRLQKPLDAGAGVVCHITSLPNAEGRPGTLGEPAKRFVDHLVAMGFKYWQVLPVNPTDSFHSPYAGPSAFAGNIDLLPETEEELRADYERWEAAGGAITDIAYRDYVEEQRGWHSEIARPSWPSSAPSRGRRARAGRASCRAGTSVCCAIPALPTRRTSNRTCSTASSSPGRTSWATPTPTASR